MKIAYEHLLKNLEERPSINELSKSLLQLGHEHEIEGNIFDMELTPNRGDCLSLNGLLRDLAVFYSVKTDFKIYTHDIDPLSINFKNKSKHSCPKISFLKIDIDEPPSSYKNELQEYFSDLNLNKNNFFNFVSNYLSYETGQTTHCYDSSMLNSALVLEEVDIDEEFETLIDKKIRLSEKNLVFTQNDTVINLAGIIGGASTACSSDTKSIILECAFFHPESIIGKALKYDIHSEACHKFERGVDPECHDYVIRRFIDIVSDHANIQDVSYISYTYEDFIQKTIPKDLDKINQILGTQINNNDFTSYLTNLGFVLKDNCILVPSHRSDVKTNNDIAEEIARVIGYDNIPAAKILIPNSYKSSSQTIENKIRLFLLDNGFYEVINNPFSSESEGEPIQIDNPLDSKKNFLRVNITNSLVDNLLYNERRQKDSIKLFEISDIYTHKNGLNKKRKLSLIASGRVGLNYEEFSKKIDINYMKAIFKVILPNKELNFKHLSRKSLDTKLKDEIVTLEVDIDVFDEDILNYKESSHPPIKFNKFVPISEMPCSFKDISFSIKDFSKTKELEKLLLNYNNDILKNIFIFDYFKNEIKNEIKIGFRFIFQAVDRTLTDKEINVVYEDIINKSLQIDNVSIPGLIR